MPRVVKLPNALLTASSDIPMYSPISERGEINLRRVFASGSLKLFKKLKEHRHLRKSSPPREQKRMTLCLTEFLAELANNMKF
jgi:hypothetical protein